MKKITTVLVDDEPRGLSSLQKLLQINCPEVEVLAQCSSADEAVTVISDLAPELVFLDIAMPEKTGFDLLGEIGQLNFEVIFVTAHNDFMLRAFQFSCVDYLLKPVVDKQLAEAVRRAGSRLMAKASSENLETLLHNVNAARSGQKPKICISSVKGFVVVKLTDIIYLEASSNYTIFHFDNNSVVYASKTIHDYEMLLEDSGFVRIHKSFIVNLEHVKEYQRGEGGTILLSNKLELDVSRRKKELFIEKMKDYYKF